MKICGYGGRKTITAGDYTYRAFCQRQVAYGKFYKQLSIGVDECLAECSKDTKCKSVQFMIMNDAHCKLMPTGEVNKAKTVIDEPSCPTSMMIGFAPTTAK
ncbi:hypothetical protein N7540_002152 [Penicillium herquei]|nr:hypothetical protein N7540_002152 [Penicillium herquei]